MSDAANLIWVDLEMTGLDPERDAIIEIAVAAHPFFRREGKDIWIDLPVTLKEAALGAQVSTPTIDGSAPISCTSRDP